MLDKLREAPFGFNKLLANEEILINGSAMRIRVFLLHNGIQPSDVYEGMAKHLHESRNKTVRLARNYSMRNGGLD